MKSTLEKLLSALLLLTVCSVSHAATCTGKFANPITDICWSCIFPINIGGVRISSLDQEDTSNPGDIACACGNPPRVGIQVSFWEPVRRVDVVRDPFCLTSLGGISLNPGFEAPVASRNRREGHDQSSFYQVHWYVDPIIFFLQAILDNGCLENVGFDIAYLTELDPMWKDDELTALLTPEVFLFGNLPARAACAADCVAATAGFPNNAFFWCAGCQGSLHPLNGNIQAHISGVQASSLMVNRIIAKLHRELLMWSAAGNNSICGYTPQPVMDKTGYKYQMLYPIPQTLKIAGKCCQPLGRSTVLWGAGREFPIQGEDFAYQIFRKRNCCQGAITLGE
ncbi:MAG: TraU family protein [Nitrosomonas sp.]|nr:TraU family protein [Nitrosomonas sp.]